ncbi:hypothetical protein DWX38_05120 [Bacteroides clarus]|uniref:Uncharacterized protein n=1 Tax=Bacteroides clarus TaxID=626929 RepID=A0A412N6V0_9BACE|nr:hypothetical protein DWX38_05120 [Bacteroides clarus]
MNIYFWEVGNKNSLLVKLTMQIIYKNNDCKYATRLASFRHVVLNGRITIKGSFTYMYKQKTV